MQDQIKARTEGQEGHALITVLVVLMPLVLMIGTFSSAMNKRNRRTEAEVQNEQALLAAEAGIDVALYLASSGSLGHKATFSGSIAGGAAYEVESILLSLDGADNDGDGAVDEADEAVFQVISRGTAQGTSRRIASYLGKNPNPYLTMGGAITTFNPNMTIDIGGSPSVTGVNHDMTGALADPGDSTSGMSIVSPNTLADLTGQLDASELSVISGSSGAGDVSVSPTFDLDVLVNTIRNQAGRVLTSDKYSGGTWGTPGSMEMVYREGDLNLSGTLSGAGILLITGNLSYSGTVDWDGLVIVLGEVRKGTGTSLIRGGMVTGPTSSVLELKGTFDLYYSKEAVDTALQLTAFYTQFNGWQELSRKP